MLQKINEQTGSNLVKASQHISETTLQNIPQNSLAQMSQYVATEARSELAKTRIDHLSPLARRRTNNNSKTTVRLIVALMSALTFSAGAQILTSRLGKLSLPAALVVGSVAGLVADEKVTQIMTKGNRQKMTQQGLNSIDQQIKTNPPANHLGQLYYQSQKGLIHQVENDNLIPQSTSDIALAVILSGAEYACSLLIILALGGVGSLALEMLAAGLPVAILWAAASLQSNLMEMPEHAHELVYKYDRYVLDSPSPNELEELNTISDEIENTQKLLQDEAENKKREMAYRQAHEQRKQEFLAKGDTSGRLKNWAMAEADFEAEWYKQQIRFFSNECNEKLEQCKFKNRSDEARLIQYYRPPIGDYSPQEISGDREEWLTSAKLELSRKLKDDLDMIKSKYDNHIQNCQLKVTQAEKKFQDLAKSNQDRYKNI